MILNFDKICKLLFSEEGRDSVLQEAVLLGFTNEKKHLAWGGGYLEDLEEDNTQFWNFRRSNIKKRGDLAKIASAYTKRKNDLDVEDMDLVHWEEFRFRGAGLYRVLGNNKTASRIFSSLTALYGENSYSASCYPVLRDIGYWSLIACAELAAEQKNILKSIELFKQAKTLGEEEFDYITKRNAAKQIEKFREEAKEELIMEYLLKFENEQREAILKKIYSAVGHGSGWRDGNDYAFLMFRNMFREYEKINKKIEEETEEPNKLKLERLGNIFEESEKFSDAARVAELVGNHKKAIGLYPKKEDGVQPLRGRENLQFYDAIRLAKKIGNKKQASNLYKEAASELEAGKFAGFHQMSRISELMEDKTKTQNYQMLAYLLGKISD